MLRNRILELAEPRRMELASNVRRQMTVESTVPQFHVREAERRRCVLDDGGETLERASLANEEREIPRVDLVLDPPPRLTSRGPDGRPGLEELMVFEPPDT